MYKKLSLSRLTLISAALLTTTPLALGGCSGGIGTAISVATGSADETLNTVIDEQGYFALLAGEKLLNQMADKAVDFKILTPGSSTAVLVANGLKKYSEVSLAAQQAKRLNDAPGVNAKIAEGSALYVHILGLVSGKQ